MFALSADSSLLQLTSRRSCPRTRNSHQEHSSEAPMTRTTAIVGLILIVHSVGVATLAGSIVARNRRSAFASRSHRIADVHHTLRQHSLACGLANSFLLCLPFPLPPQNIRPCQFPSRGSRGAVHPSLRGDQGTGARNCRRPAIACWVVGTGKLSCDCNATRVKCEKARKGEQAMALIASRASQRSGVGPPKIPLQHLSGIRRLHD